MRFGVVYHQLISSGGLERYLLGFVRSLLQRGHEVDVVAARTDGGGEGCGATIHLTGGGRVRTADDLLAFDEASHRIVSGLGCDVVLGFGRTTRQDVHRAGGGCHKVYSEMLPVRKRAGRKNRVELELEERLYTGGGTGKFVVNSGKVGRELEREYGVDPGAVTVVHTPVDGARYSPDIDGEVRGRVRNEKLVDRNRPVLLYVAREHGRKGLGVLVEAVRGTGVELWVAGPPLPIRLRLGPPANLKYLGEGADLVELYRAADWFVHPTRYDACANTVLQSMACGLPGLISVNDGASEFVAAGENGFLLERPEDPAAVREVIERAVALGEDERRAMGERSRAAVADLTWERHVEAWLELVGER